MSQTMGAGDPADLVKQVEKLLEAKPEAVEKADAKKPADK